MNFHRKLVSFPLHNDNLLKVLMSIDLKGITSETFVVITMRLHLPLLVSLEWLVEYFQLALLQTTSLQLFLSLANFEKHWKRFRTK